MASIKERLESKIHKNPTSGCWEWTGCRNHCGYGKIYINRKAEYSHRISYIEYVGDIPAGMCILHKCDNQKCVNPDHLFAGTQSHNMFDMWAKNRHKRGCTKGAMFVTRTKLTDEKVRQIKGSDLPRSDLAIAFDVSKQVISQIRNSLTWKHV